MTKSKIVGMLAVTIVLGIVLNGYCGEEQAKDSGDKDVERTITFIRPSAELNFSDLMDGSTIKPVVVYQCAQKEDGACDKSTLIKHEGDGFQGFRKMVYEFMSSIKQKTAWHIPLSKTEKAFLDAVPLPILNILKTSDTDLSAFDTAVMLTGDIAATFYTIHVLNQTAEYYCHREIIGTECEISDVWMRDIMNDAREILIESTKGLDAYNKIIGLSKTLRTSAASLHTNIKKSMVCISDGKEIAVQPGSTEELLSELNTMPMTGDLLECKIYDKSGSIVQMSFALKTDSAAKGYKMDCDVPFADINASKSYIDADLLLTDLFRWIATYIDSEKKETNSCKIKGEGKAEHIRLSRSFLTKSND